MALVRGNGIACRRSACDVAPATRPIGRYLPLIGSSCNIAVDVSCTDAGTDRTAFGNRAADTHRACCCILDRTYSQYKGIRDACAAIRGCNREAYCAIEVQWRCAAKGTGCRIERQPARQCIAISQFCAVGKCITIGIAERTYRDRIAPSRILSTSLIRYCAGHCGRGVV